MSITQQVPGSITAKEAVRAAKTAVADLFAEEGPSEIGLEELNFDAIQSRWEVTIGFSRPWLTSAKNQLALMMQPTRRDYKLVFISESGEIIGLRNREP